MIVNVLQTSNLHPSQKQKLASDSAVDRLVSTVDELAKTVRPHFDTDSRFAALSTFSPPPLLSYLF